MVSLLPLSCFPQMSQRSSEVNSANWDQISKPSSQSVHSAAPIHGDATGRSGSEMCEDGGKFVVFFFDTVVTHDLEVFCGERKHICVDTLFEAPPALTDPLFPIAAAPTDTAAVFYQSLQIRPVGTDAEGNCERG